MKKILILFASAALVMTLSTSCDSGLKKEMNLTEFQQFVQNHPQDSILPLENHQDCYYKVINKGTEREELCFLDYYQYFLYNIKVSDLEGNEIESINNTTGSGVYMAAPYFATATNPIRGALQSMNDGQVNVIYITNNCLHDFTEHVDKTYPPMVAITVERVKTITEFPVKVNGHEFTVALHDKMNGFLEKAGMKRDAIVATGPHFDDPKFEDEGLYQLAFKNEKANNFVSTVFKTGDSDEIVSIFFIDDMGRPMLPDESIMTY